MNVIDCQYKKQQILKINSVIIHNEKREKRGRAEKETKIQARKPIKYPTKTCFEVESQVQCTLGNYILLELYN